MTFALILAAYAVAVVLVGYAWHIVAWYRRTVRLVNLRERVLS